MRAIIDEARASDKADYAALEQTTSSDEEIETGDENAENADG